MFFTDSVGHYNTGCFRTCTQYFQEHKGYVIQAIPDGTSIPNTGLAQQKVRFKKPVVFGKKHPNYKQKATIQKSKSDFNNSSMTLVNQIPFVFQ